jgi:hypothetical protein
MALFTGYRTFRDSATSSRVRASLI